MRIIFKPVHIKIKIIRWRRACGGNRNCNSKVKREYRFHPTFPSHSLRAAEWDETFTRDEVSKRSNNRINQSYG